MRTGLGAFALAENNDSSSTLQTISRQELRQLIRLQLEALLERQNLAGAKTLLIPVHPPDVAEAIEGLPEAMQAIAFRLLPKDKAIEVYEHLDSSIQQVLVEEFKRQEVLDIVDKMSPDDRARLFDELPAKVVSRLLGQLSPAERRSTALLLGYEANTAGRIMTPEYISLKENWTVAQTLERIRNLANVSETVYYLYITDVARHLSGILSLRDLVTAQPEQTIGEIMTRDVLFVHTEADQEEVAQTIQRYDFLAVPVVDREQRLVGIVTVDDVIDILEAEATEDIQKLAGGGGDEAALSAPSVTLRKRLPWLLGNIGLYVIAASAIVPFQGTIQLFPVLAVIMPTLSNTSGNVGIQALAVTVRGLGVGEVTLRDTTRILQKEILAGLLTAVALGLSLGLLSLIWSTAQDRWVGLVAGLVMAINVLAAATLGTLLPMGLKRINLDPALISGPLLTTILDAFGFFTFLGLITISLAFFS